PVVTISGDPETSNENVELSLTSTVTDAGALDTHTYAWSVTKNGDAYDLGDTVTDESTLTFTPVDNGAYVVTLTVTDNNGGTGSATSDIAVVNVAPTATISGAPTDTITEGTEVSVTAHPTDASPA